MFELLAQATQVAKNTPQEAANGYIVLSLVAAVFILPQILSFLITKYFRVREYQPRLNMVLLSIIASITPIGYQMVVNQKSLGECFRLGIDLAGGTNLVFRIDPKALSDIKKDSSKKDLNSLMDNMVGAIARRVNPSGAEDVTVRRVGEDRVEIIVPGADQAYVSEMKQRITQLGSLEFQILATGERSDHRDYIKKARALPPDEDTVYMNSAPVARWVSTGEDERISRAGGDSLPAESRQVKIDGKDVTQWLAIITPEKQAVTGEHLHRASVQRDQRTAQLSVGFQLTQEGGVRFLALFAITCR